jgi:hypothetical protein
VGDQPAAEDLKRGRGEGGQGEGGRGEGASDGRYYRKSIEIIDTYKSIDTFDTRKKYR